MVTQAIKSLAHESVGHKVKLEVEIANNFSKSPPPPPCKSKAKLIRNVVDRAKDVINLCNGDSYITREFTI